MPRRKISPGISRACGTASPRAPLRGRLAWPRRRARCAAGGFWGHWPSPGGRRDRRRRDVVAASRSRPSFHALTFRRGSMGGARFGPGPADRDLRRFLAGQPVAALHDAHRQHRVDGAASFRAPIFSRSRRPAGWRCASSANRSRGCRGLDRGGRAARPPRGRRPGGLFPRRRRDGRRAQRTSSSPRPARSSTIPARTRRPAIRVSPRTAARSLSSRTTARRTRSRSSTLRARSERSPTAGSDQSRSPGILGPEKSGSPPASSRFRRRQSSCCLPLRASPRGGPGSPAAARPGHRPRRTGPPAGGRLDGDDDVPGTRSGQGVRLTWLDDTRPPTFRATDNCSCSTRAASPKGRMKPSTCERQTAPARSGLGDGVGQVLSPDGKWACAAGRRPRPLPTGPGESRSIPTPGIQVQSAGWFPDGKRIFWFGSASGRPGRMYVQEVASGAPRAISPRGSLDGRSRPTASSSLARNQEKSAFLFPVDGGEPRPLPGAQGERPLVSTRPGRASSLPR